MVDYCLMSIFGVATPFRHRGLKIVLIFSCRWCSTYSHCRCREAKFLPCAQLWCRHSSILTCSEVFGRIRIRTVFLGSWAGYEPYIRKIIIETDLIKASLDECYKVIFCLILRRRSTCPAWRRHFSLIEYLDPTVNRSRFTGKTAEIMLR